MAKINHRHKHLLIAESVIHNFNLNPDNYILFDSTLAKKNKNIMINNSNNNKIYAKDEIIIAKININFLDTKNCTIYLGEAIKGNITIKINHNDSIVYIGDYCNLRKVIIDSNQKNDLIVIGNYVTTNINNQWRSGLRSGNGNPSIIIGDDCMFGADIVIRNTDAHPVYNIDNEEQMNQPKSLILIEEHVWIGQKVNILKDVKIGACSIVALGSIVTKDIGRFSIAKGIPAEGSVDRKLYWSISTQQASRKKAKDYTKKYLAITNFTEVSR